MTTDPTQPLYETHMHTPLCGHATGDPEDYARQATARGLAGIIVTCHNPLPDTVTPKIRMRVDQFDAYCALVERARRAMRGVIDVRLGLECDYMPGLEGWLEKQTGWADFDYILGSVHPHLEEYRRRFWEGDIVAYQKTYFRHLADSAETGLFDTVAHPDLVKIIEPEAWRPERLSDDIVRALDRIARTGVAMELNTSGRNKALSEMNPGRSILAAMKARQIPVVVGADAHVPERVGEGYDEALRVLSEVGYTHVNIFLKRRRIPVPIGAARRALAETGSR